MDVTKSAGLSRRTIVKGAAWSVPVIAAAVAVPMAAASAIPGNNANYHWQGESQENWSTLTNDTWSAQIVPNSPVSGAAISITVVFNQPVTLSAIVTNNPTWSGPQLNSTATSFTFTQPTGGWGHNLTFSFTFPPGAAGSTLTSTGVMFITPSSAAEWTAEAAVNSLTLAAR